MLVILSCFAIMFAWDFLPDSTLSTALFVSTLIIKSSSWTSFANVVLQTCMTFITNTPLIVWSVLFPKLRLLDALPNSSTTWTTYPTYTGHYVFRLAALLTKTPRTKLLSMGGKNEE